MVCPPYGINHFSTCLIIGCPPTNFLPNLFISISNNIHGKRKGDIKLEISFKKFGRSHPKFIFFGHKTFLQQIYFEQKNYGLCYIATRLYRFLIAHSLLSQNILVYFLILPWNISYHRPFFLEISANIDFMLLPLCDYPIWGRTMGFNDLVKKIWSEWIMGNRVLTQEQHMK